MAGTVFAQSFLDAPPLLSVWFGVWFATFPPVFFAGGVMILVLNALMSRSTGFVASPRRTVSWWSLAWRLVVAAALFTVLALTGAGPSNAPSGQPVTIDGRYYVNNHGTKTEISKDEYVAISASWVRWFTGAEMLIAGAAVLVLSGPWARKDIQNDSARCG